MNQFSAEQIMAFADGELDAATHSMVNAALATDPALAARVAQHRALRRDVFASFADILDAPVPLRLQQAANAPLQGVPALHVVGTEKATAASTRHALRSPGQAPRWQAMAAMLLVGVAAGAIGTNAFNLSNPSGSSAPIATVGTGLFAQHQLAHALSEQLASTQAADASTKIGISFKAADGHFCRSFTMTAAAAEPGTLAGLACRAADQRWQIALLVHANAAAVPPGNFRMAGSETPGPILQEIDRRIDGAPLDAAAEKAALVRHWQ